MDPNYETDRLEPDCYEEPDPEETVEESDPGVTFTDDEW